jgi:guanylate kinase
VVYLDIDRSVRESRLLGRQDKNDSVTRRLDADDIDFQSYNDYDLKITDPEFSSDDVYDLMD